MDGLGMSYGIFVPTQWEEEMGLACISSKCMIGVWIRVNPPQDDLYQKLVSLVLGLQEFGLLMVGSRLVEAPWDAGGDPLSGYAIMS
jgi:hypothetical protein